MLGAICGDVIGRPYEFEAPTTNYDFELFTDQSRFSDGTVMTAAIDLRAVYDQFAERVAHLRPARR